MRRRVCPGSGRGRTARPAPATSVRRAAGTTGSSSSAGPNSACATPRCVGPARPAGAWTRPVPHAPPEPAVRAFPALPGPADPLDQLGPLDYEAEWWHHDPTDPRWDDPDPVALELRADDVEPDADPAADIHPDDHDPLRDRLLHDDTRWTLDLDDPYGWIDLRLPCRDEDEPDVDRYGELATASGSSLRP